MRTWRVTTNLTCNQNCTYCTSRSARDERAFVDARAVRARIDAALAQGAREIVLTGGEPALRSDLASLVGHARDGGADDVVLETNATPIDGPGAKALRAAGLTLARVNLSGWGEALDAVTRDPGGFAAARKGLDALFEAQIPVEIVATVVRSTEPLLRALPDRLASIRAREGAIAGLRLVVPVEAADPRELLDYETIASLLTDIDVAARVHSLAVKLDPATAPPPCIFPARTRPAHLFALTPGASPREDRVRIAACDECQIADRCSGISTAYQARFGSPNVEPIRDDKARRRLSVISSVAAQIERELVSPSVHRLPGEDDVHEAIVRVNFHCNQSCRFCFVSTHLPAATDERVERAIREAGESGAKVILSGGEPTLNARLVDYVRLARSVSRHPVQLQTNAIRLADPTLVRSLVEAGVTEAFVSLHGSNAAIADAVTSAPGTFARTVLGIDELVRAGVKTILNFVFCETNYLDFPAYVRMVAMRWPTAEATVSFVAPSTDVVPRDREFIPRYADILPPLAEGLAASRALGLRVAGFESMCGIPLCLVPASIESFFSIGELAEGSDGGEFAKPEPCSRCALSQRCYGIRRGYLALHGASELRPVAHELTAQP